MIIVYIMLNLYESSKKTPRKNKKKQIQQGELAIIYNLLEAVAGNNIKDLISLFIVFFVSYKKQQTFPFSEGGGGLLLLVNKPVVHFKDTFFFLALLRF